MSRDHLSKREAKKLYDYLDTIKPLLRVADWQVDLVAEWADDDCWASVWSNDEKKYARLSVSKSWTNLSADDRRNTLVHEMLHLLHRDMLEPFFLLGDAKMMPAKVFQVTERNIRHHTEVMVDTLAHIIAPSMPEYPS